MPKVVILEHGRILSHVVHNIPSQVVLYSAETGVIRWHSPNLDRAPQGLSLSRGMNLGMLLHSEEVESWLLEGRLVLNSGRPLEYVKHVQGKLAYVQIQPASTRKRLAMRITTPLDRVLQLAEQYLQAQYEGDITLAGQT